MRARHLVVPVVPSGRPRGLSGRSKEGPANRKPRVGRGLLRRAADGIRTHDLLHGKRSLQDHHRGEEAPAQSGKTPFPGTTAVDPPRAADAARSRRMKGKNRKSLPFPGPSSFWFDLAVPAVARTRAGRSVGCLPGLALCCERPRRVAQRLRGLALDRGTPGFERFCRPASKRERGRPSPRVFRCVLPRRVPRRPSVPRRRSA
jgi:hypothetical protein